MKAFFEKFSQFLSTLRVWTVNLLTLGFLLYIVFIVAAVVRQMPEPVDPAGKVLIIAPEGLILDQEVFPANFEFPFNMPDRKQIQSRDLVKVIRAAAADDSLAGVLVDFSQASFAGPSTALLIAGELAVLKEGDKPVIAYSEVLSNASYMMAAQADEIYVHPSGAVALSGLGGYREYYKQLAAKLRITIHDYSQGSFKSANESLTRNEMSDADRQQRREYIEPIWQTFKELMAGGREVDVAAIQRIAEEQPMPLIAEAGYDNLAFALEQGLIDATMSLPEFRAHMIERFGRADDDERETYPHIGADAYFAQLPPEISESEDAVAVVFVQGAISPGAQGPGVAGSDDVSRLIRQAYEDDNNKALIVRVNSPGGSIIASDQIRDEIEAASSRGLPVYISMGDIAASGGVWISTPADRIFAEQTTITGSIGVAVALPTFERSLDYVGIGIDGFATSTYAGWNAGLPVSEELDGIFSRWASSAYERFINQVAEDREKDTDYIRSIAGGRVWLAPKALELGLVDEMGGLEQVVAAAADTAGLTDYRVNYVVKEPSPIYRILQQFSVALGVTASPVYSEFESRLQAWMGVVGNLTRPRAAVMCTVCEVNLN